MAYTYLDITNEVLARFNEVALTSANFANSRGFQTQCKNAVNDAINYIFQREFGWSFSHAEQTETLVANTTRYSIGATVYNVDYETFRISKDNTLGVAGVTLRIMDYNQYVDKFIDQETPQMLAVYLSMYSVHLTTTMVSIHIQIKHTHSSMTHM